jgi:hypothetical protein
MSALDAYLAEVSARPFDWRQWNCCHLARGWWQQVTGLDPMAGLPGTDSMRAAHRLIGELGGNLAAAWTRQTRCEPLPAALAQVGDVVLLETPERHAVGICCGRTAAVLTPDLGLAHAPMSAATLAWRPAP